MTVQTGLCLVSQLLKNFDFGFFFCVAVQMLIFMFQVNVEWKKDSKQFDLTFGSQGQATTINPHVVMATQVQQELNETRSLPHIVQVGGRT